MEKFDSNGFEDLYKEPIDYTRFDFECVASDEWVVTAKQLNLNSNAILNSSTAFGTTVTNALDWLYGLISNYTLLNYTSIGIVPCATPVNWNFNTSGGYYAWRGSGLQGSLWGSLPILPDGGTLITLSVTILPVTHGSLPSQMPQFRLYRNTGITAGSVFIVTDTSTLAVYNTVHTLTGTVTAPRGIIAGTNFIWEMVDEGGLSGLEIVSIKALIS